MQISQRRQRTIGRSVRVPGFGLFCGADVTLEFCPAGPGHGIIFERTDLSRPVQIPALVEYVVPRPRCSMIAHCGTAVMVIEHVMAALAGLRIDNCLVRIDAPEPPVGDGSSRPFVEALLDSGIVEQDARRETVVIRETLLVTESEQVGVAVQPALDLEYEIGFVLDYGPGPIPRQSLSLAIGPESFPSELADCRTFALEQEVRGMRAQGLALRAGHENALVFGAEGILENELRRPDECVRHKILDCVGDFALLGCDIVGRFTATRSGHRLNHEIIRRIRAAYGQSSEAPPQSQVDTGRFAPAQRAG